MPAAAGAWRMATRAKPERINTCMMRDCKCPMMQEMRGKTVMCEAPMDGANVILKFRSGRKMENHAEIYCKGNYRYCEIYRMVMAAKYED